jgi:(S)-2-hydroxyglutarate dehydrogenase
MLKPRLVIIGGGIVGLATAYRLLEKDSETKITVLEKESTLGTHQTGHNSGVIHAGLYYQPGSLKARLATSGRRQMIEFCEKNTIPFEICGKVVVATDEIEIPRLEKLFDRGTQNGLKGLRFLEPDELKEREPHARAKKALLVPEEGIVDYKQVCSKLAQWIKALGGEIVTDCRVKKIIRRDEVTIIETTQGEYEAQFVINCAGLHSDRILKKSGANRNIKIVPFRGEYYSLKDSSKHLVNHLIYPVPDPDFPFLGVHFTRGIDGMVECGPNAVLALKREGYRKSDISLRDTIDTFTFKGFWKFAAKHWNTGTQELVRSFSKRAFCQSLQKLIPSIQVTDLEAGGAGVRAQAMDENGNLIQDFSIVRDKRILHVLNTPSPAATASLAIGSEIAAMINTDSVPS